MDFALGQGVYTISEAARHIGEPVQRVRAWAKRYWGGEGYGALGGVPSIDFKTLLELKTFVQLSQAGVASRKIEEARTELQRLLQDEHPFARRDVLANPAVDGKRVTLFHRG